MGQNPNAKVDPSPAVGSALPATAAVHWSLLMRVSEVLLSTDEPDEVVGRLAQVIVPELADWSFITVVDEDGNLRDVGLAHRDPERVPDLQAYSDRHLDDMTEVAAVAVGLRTGQPVVVPRLSDEVLANFLPDPAVASLTRRLDPYGVAVFPLSTAERTFGVLVSVTTGPRGSHTAEELTTLREVARRAGPVLGAARAAQRARNFGETMQRTLLQVASPGRGLVAAMRYLPAHHDRQVGGDWYDLFTVDDGSTVATIGDVMGHDLTAIAAMAQLRSFMRANAWQLRHSPAVILTATDAVNLGLGPATFATALTLEFAPPSEDGSTGLRWSNAGHLPPILLAADGSVTLLEESARPDPPLGVRADVARVDRVTTLAPGSTVLLYTDGLVERRDRDIDAGLDELVTLLRAASTADLESLLDAAIVALGLDAERDDDIALLAIRIAGPAGG